MSTVKVRRLTRRAVLQIYGLVFLLVLALLVALAIAAYRKTFVPVVHVTLQTDRIGNQLAPPADVKLRGVIVGEVRAVHTDGEQATIDLALDPDQVDLIPANVSARLLPKTLFGEKYVDLVIPAQPDPRRLGEGDTIPQDRSEVAIELEKVLDDVYPLLTAVEPQDLAITLNAMAGALDGRGDDVGANVDRLHDYLERLNPHLPTLSEDIAALAKFADTYADAAPDLLQVLRNATVTSKTMVEKEDALDAFLTDVTGTAGDAHKVLRANERGIITLGRVSAPTLAVLAEYSPSYPCLLEGLADFTPRVRDVFSTGSLHITLEVVRPRDPYQSPQDLPEYGERRGPTCYNLPNPQVPAPAHKFADGTEPRDESWPIDRLFTGTAYPSRGVVGTIAEQQVINAVVAPVMGVPADEVPPVATLLFGPMARETVVNVE